MLTNKQTDTAENIHLSPLCYADGPPAYSVAERGGCFRVGKDLDTNNESACRQIQDQLWRCYSLSSSRRACFLLEQADSILGGYWPTWLTPIHTSVQWPTRLTLTLLSFHRVTWPTWLTLIHLSFHWLTWIAIPTYLVDTHSPEFPLTHLGGYWPGVQRQNGLHDARANARTFQQNGCISGTSVRAVQLAKGRLHLVELFRLAGGRKGHHPSTSMH